MLVNAFDGRVDADRRVTIPSQYRSSFRAGLVISKGPGLSLQLRSPEAFDAFLEATLGRLHRLSSEARRVHRYYNANSFDADIDSAGRITLPEVLAVHAALDRDVVVADVGRRVDLWNPQVRWSTALQHVEVPTELPARLGALNQALIDRLASNPKLMLSLGPREFEELVADLYEKHGFSVELTPKAGDEGVDIYAVRHTAFGKLLTIVDCKRYRPDRPVGVGLVRQLVGTIETKRATAGVIATTSYFTSGAKDMRNQYPFRIGLQDFFDLQAMLAPAIPELVPTPQLLDKLAGDPHRAPSDVGKSVAGKRAARAGPLAGAPGDQLPR